MISLYKEEYKTKVGSILMEIESSINSSSFIKIHNSLTTISMPHHYIEVYTFEDIKKWLKGTDNEIEYAKGWMIKATKTSDQEELITFRCELDDINSSIEISPNSGEHLDAIWIDNQTNIVSIGTEDNEIMKYRANKNDCMPKRLEESGQDFLFTKYTNKGFLTEVPELMKGEQIYFHYLLAGNPKKKSNQYPDEEDMATWFAVDYPKQVLVDRLYLLDW